MTVDYEERLKVRAEREALERVRDRWCEALAGGRWQKDTRFGRLVLLPPASAAFWTKIHREDSWADYAGLPAAPEGWGKGRCEFTWSWRVFDDYDSETCGSESVVATDLDSEQQRCVEHLAEALELDNPYLVRKYPIKFLFSEMRGATS
jgi:hypothetical protein